METTIALFVRFSRSWQAKPRAERQELEARHLRPLLASYSTQLAIRSFNSLGFDPRFSHLVLISAPELKNYYYFIEELRDSFLLAQGYLEVTRIVLGYEDGYPQFDQERTPA
jgi:hypothetical protein